MSRKNRYFVLALILFLFFQVLDGFMTHGAVNGGLVQEANWLVAGMVDGGGFLMFKVFGAFFCAVILWVVHRRFTQLALLTVAAAVLFYGIVMTWNLYILATV